MLVCLFLEHGEHLDDIPIQSGVLVLTLAVGLLTVERPIAQEIARLGTVLRTATVECIVYGPYSKCTVHTI